MTFNPNADIGGGKTSKRGRNTGIAVGGGLGVIALVIISQLLGVDVTAFVAAMVLFLCSEAGRNITGQALSVCAGVEAL